MDSPSSGRNDVEKVQEALKRRIRREGLTLRQVEERLGRKGDYLRQVLAGKIELKWEHVAGVLAALGVHPVEFFVEVYGRPPGRPDELGSELMPFPSSRHLVRWSSLRVLIWEFKEKGIFTAEEAELLLAKLENAVPPT